MKNKYFDLLKEEGLRDEEDEIPEENLLPISGEEDEKKVRHTVFTMLLFLGLFTVVEALLVLFLLYGSVTEWSKGKGQALLGLALGSAVAVFWLFTMKRNVEDSLTPGEAHPKAKIRIGAVLRYLLLAGLLVFAVFTHWIDPVLLLVGVFNLKLAGYASWIFDKKHAERAGTAV